MTRDRIVPLITALLLAVGPGCATSTSGDVTGSGGGDGSGGTTGSGGHLATGGSTASGGNGPGTGGTISSGGTTGRGGSGGTSSTGGSGGTTGTAGHGSGGNGSGGNGAGGSGGSRNTGGNGSGGNGGGNGLGGSTASGGSTAAASCLDGMQNGSETGVDCGGSCGACPNYKINAPNTKNSTQSSCNNGGGYMCARSMVYSPEMKQAEADDFGSPTNPAFVYGTVGHDADNGGLDSGNTCCQCYQLVFTTPKDPVSGVPAPKPMIVQAFNTAAGGPKNFDIYMAMGGYGNFNGCSKGMYSAVPSIGEPGMGGIRVENLSQCSMNGFTLASVSSASCQSAVTSTCQMIKSNTSSIESTSQNSCIETNQPQNLYHMNWNVLAKRVECPTNLTRVTGCKLNNQNLPKPDPTAVDQASASGKGFSSGYGTTSMQDCCRPTCAWSTNVSNADSQYGVFYTCDASGNPS